MPGEKKAGHFADQQNSTLTEDHRFKNSAHLELQRVDSLSLHGTSWIITTLQVLEHPANVQNENFWDTDRKFPRARARRYYIILSFGKSMLFLPLSINDFLIIPYMFE